MAGTRIALASGEERTDLDVMLSPVPVASIEGLIAAEGPPAAHLDPSITALDGAVASLDGAPKIARGPDTTGRFRLSNVLPGRYRLMARDRLESASGTVTRFGVAEIDVNGTTDVPVTLALRPAAQLTGRLNVDARAPSSLIDLARARIELAPFAVPTLGGVGAMHIGDDFVRSIDAASRAEGTFAIGDLPPARYAFECVVPPSGGVAWRARSAIVDGHDILDDGLVISPDRALTDIIVTLTDRHTTLSGRLLQANDRPASAYFIVVFPVDPVGRRSLRRVKMIRPNGDGEFRFTDLPPDDYFISALTDVDPNEWQQPEFLQGIVASAVRVRLTDDVGTRIDLRIR